MATIIWDDVVAHAAQLSTLDVDARNAILAHVNTALVPKKFGGESSPKLKLARVYLAAHLATVGPASGGTITAGPVTSETVGGVSRTYANLASASAESQAQLQGSTYGQLFLELVRTSSARGPMVL